VNYSFNGNINSSFRAMAVEQVNRFGQDLNLQKKAGLMFRTDSVVVFPI